MANYVTLAQYTSIQSLITPKINIKDDLLILGSQRSLLPYLQGGGQISAQENVTAGSQEKVGLPIKKNLAEYLIIIAQLGSHEKVG